MSNLSAALLMYALAIGVALLVAVVIKAIVAATALFARAPTVAAPVEPLTVAAAAIPSRHLVIIAAAAQAMLGSAQRIVHIEDAGRGRAWTSSTRAAHYASHMPRHRH